MTQTSEHEVRIFRVLTTAGDWLTAPTIAERANVAGRTARHHLARMAGQGVAERRELHDGYRYKLSATVPATYLGRISAAAEAFGVSVR